MRLFHTSIDFTNLLCGIPLFLCLNRSNPCCLHFCLPPCMLITIQPTHFCPYLHPSSASLCCPPSLLASPLVKTSSNPLPPCSLSTDPVVRMPCSHCNSPGLFPHRASLNHLPNPHFSALSENNKHSSRSLYSCISVLLWVHPFHLTHLTASFSQH